jgi:hypothetical protein
MLPPSDSDSDEDEEGGNTEKEAKPKARSSCGRGCAARLAMAPTFPSRSSLAADRPRCTPHVNPSLAALL